MSTFNLALSIDEKLKNSNTEDVAVGDSINCVVYAKHTSTHIDEYGTLKMDNGHNLLVTMTQLENVIDGNELQVDIVSSALPTGAATESTLSNILITDGNISTLLDKCSTYGSGTHQLRTDIISTVAPVVSKTDVYSTGNTLPSSTDVLLTAQSLGNKRCVGIFVQLSGDTRNDDIRLQIRAGNDGSGAVQRRYEEITVGRVFDGTTDTIYSYEHPKFPFDNIRVYLVNNTLSSQTYEVQIEFSDA